MDRLLDLEAEEKVLKGAKVEAPADTPNIHPNIPGIYAEKIERLAEALNHPEDRDEAADAIRGLIERVTLTPGAKRGEAHVTLQGEFGTILEWPGAQQKKKARNDDSPEACATGLARSATWALTWRTL